MNFQAQMEPHKRQARADRDRVLTDVVNGSIPDWAAFVATVRNDRRLLRIRYFPVMAGLGFSKQQAQTLLNPLSGFNPPRNMKVGWIISDPYRFRVFTDALECKFDSPPWRGFPFADRPLFEPDPFESRKP